MVLGFIWIFFLIIWSFRNIFKCCLWILIGMGSCLCWLWKGKFGFCMLFSGILRKCFGNGIWNGRLNGMIWLFSCWIILVVILWMSVSIMRISLRVWSLKIGCCCIIGCLFCLVFFIVLVLLFLFCLWRFIVLIGIRRMLLLFLL